MPTEKEKIPQPQQARQRFSIEDSRAYVKDMPNRNTGKMRPILIIERWKDDVLPFEVGLARARLVVRHIEAIKKYLEEHGK